MTHYSTEEDLQNRELEWHEQRQVEYEERQLERQQERQAFRDFFTEHNWDSRYQWLHRIPDDLRSELLRCDWCHCQATTFQKIPCRAMFCSSCAKQLRALRRKQWLDNRRYKENELMNTLAAKWAEDTSKEEKA